MGFNPTTLVDHLSPMLDRVRAIPSRLGVQPYRVFLLTTRWSENEYGEGTESLVSETEITPPPLVELGVTIDFRPFGADCSGKLVLSQISLRYSEEELVPTVPEGTQFYFEVRRTDGANRVRAFPDTKPVRNGKKGLGWSLQCQISDMPRTDSGNLYGTGSTR
jgi:hypothetical protein